MLRRTLVSQLATCALAGAAWAQTPQTTLTVTGDVAAPLTLKAEDLAAMPREKVSVSEEDGTKVEYEGVPLREILKKRELRWVDSCAARRWRATY